MKVRLLTSWKDRGRIGRGEKVRGLHWAGRRRRHLRVIYVPDPEPESVFVITAYELTGKPLLAYRRRRRKKHQ